VAEGGVVSTAAVVGVFQRTVHFYTVGLQQKFGFDDGNLLAYAWSEFCAKYSEVKLPTSASHHDLLRRCLAKFVFPVLDPPQEIPGILLTSHNPVRISYGGKLAPEVVSVPLEYIELVFCGLLEDLT
jgi:hypothetical protein